MGEDANDRERKNVDEYRVMGNEWEQWLGKIVEVRGNGGGKRRMRI